ncbi:MAG: hypothetical protein JZU65_03995 [Chlorobium sp.]|nr:hypothetical protein [Chlorobium sp.]
MQATKINTKTNVIITALEQLIRKSKISEIKNYKGQVELEIDLDVIRGRKCQLQLTLLSGLSISEKGITVRRLIF